MKKVAVLLAGSGVCDGSEIHEAVFSLLAIEEANATYQCFAPDKSQFHVVDHTTGEPTGETRNVLVESARIARGDVKPVTELSPDDYDALLIPGGFGAAKNLNQWAIKGPEGQLDADVRRVIRAFHAAGKPLCGLCMGPTVLAQALGSDPSVELTVGTTKEASPYDIAGINGGLQSVGARPVEKTVREVAVDEQHKVVTAPCYMMEASISEVRNNVKQAVDALMRLTQR
jgi:enhancing lycopene biosynthesis protein 2